MRWKASRCLRRSSVCRAVLAPGGEVWRLVRPDLSELPGGASEHQSETELTDNEKYSLLFMNSIPLADLPGYVDRVIR